MLTDCVLCPRNCHADRINGRRGRCHETAEIVVAELRCICGKNLAYPEMLAQEPYFFRLPDGLRFCQNHNIAEAKAGKTITVERLSEIFLELQEKGRPISIS